jgi:hypothetical protein
LSSFHLGIHDSCNSGEKRRQNIHTPNSHVPAPRLPPAVGSGLLSSFRACLLACLLACWRAGLLVSRVLRPFLLACLLRACSPARLLFAPLACWTACCPCLASVLSCLLASLACWLACCPSCLLPFLLACLLHSPRSLSDCRPIFGVGWRVCTCNGLAVWDEFQK